MTLSRREFIGSVGAFALCRGMSSAEALLGGSPKLKFGVLSDIHITTWQSAETFRRALRFYRAANVDAVMICGDLADLGVLCNLENVGRSWDEVFPDNRGLDGKRVEKVFIYGNHDVEPMEYGIGGTGLAHLLMKCPGYRADEVRQQRLPLVGLDKAWERCFHEPYAPIYRKTICGYDFIGAHWDTQARVRGLEDWFARNGKTLDPSRPFFYCQHPHPKNTVYTSSPFCHDDGTATRVLSGYPNAVAFSGHSHVSLTEERGLWRGAFTSIGASTLTPNGGAGTACLKKNAQAVSDRVQPARQGMLVTVFDDRLVLERRDFAFGEPIDEAWVVPLPAKAEPFAARAARTVAPQFAADARAAILFAKKLGGDGAVRFPQALAEPRARPYDYRISIAYRFGESEEDNHAFNVYAPTVLLPKAHDGDVRRVEIPVPADCLPKYDMGEARLVVTPRNAWGVAGRSLDTGWVTVPKV